MHLKLFFSISVIGLAILPIFNLLSIEKFDSDSLKLYSTDNIEEIINPYLIKRGISPEPDQVVIGKNGWLFLGDLYENTLTASRRGAADPQVVQTSHEIVENQKKWLEYYSENNVEDFKILVAPNKSSIYASNMPEWAQPQSSSISEHLYKDNNIYIDVRSELLSDDALLYFYTDTHWNFYAAGIAFNKLIRSLESKEKLVLPPAEWTKLVSVGPCKPGDLARFLKTKTLLEDKAAYTGINQIHSEYQHTISDYLNNSVVYEGTLPNFGNPHHPYVIHTANALNNKKVLWLSDSFGIAMAKYMTSTFSHVFKQHWMEVVGTQQLEQLIKEWQPDYVIMTVVERNCLYDHFSAKTPGYLDWNNFDNIEDLRKPSLNDLIKIGTDKYKITGPDPYFVYKINSTANIDSLRYKIACRRNKISIATQLFWSTEDSGFNENDSIRFKSIIGSNQFDLPQPSKLDKSTSLRLDLDATAGITDFSLSEVQIGKLKDN